MTTNPPSAADIAEACCCGQAGCSCTRRFGKNLVGHCPAHDDATPSLSITETTDGKILVNCRTGCSQEAVIAALQAKGVWPHKVAVPVPSRNGHAPIGKPPMPPAPKAAHPPRGPVVATYDYTDEAGTVLHQTLRFEPGKDGKKKDFSQRRPDGQGGWAWNMDCRRVLYHLPEVVEAVAAGKAVYLCEGEKDADALRSLGLCATCNPMGAGKWEDGYTETLCGAGIVVLPDNDNAGREHAQKVAAALSGRAKRVRVVELPGLPEKGDVSDWIAAGGTLAELVQLVKVAPDWTPPTQDTPTAEKPGKPPPIAQRLIELGLTCDLFLSDRDEPFATFRVNGHSETRPLRSEAYKHWLHRAYYAETGKSANAQATQDALSVLEAQCRYDSPTRPLSLRVARADNAIWFDRGSDQWDAVKITEAGWQIVAAPPVLFRRYAPTWHQVLPKAGGTVELLRAFINVRDENAWRQLVVWLVAALLPDIPHPVLVVHGEQGSAKSTLMRLLSWLIDPSRVPLRSEPRDIGEWIQAADHSWLVTLDNVSHLPGWLSDAICRAVTGEGFSKRQLYTDSEDVILSFQRVVALTGIEVVAQRSDLLDRALLLPLSPITQETRRLESVVLSEFETVRPLIVGALLDTLAGVLRLLPSVTLAQMPRMADFARVGVAVEQALGWPAGSFMDAYSGNIKEQHEEALSASVVGEMVQKLLTEGSEWEGTASELLQALAKIGGENVTRRRDWPANGRVLSGQLKRLSTNLRFVGIGVDYSKTHGKRLISLTRQETQKCAPSVPCVPSLSEGAENGTQTRFGGTQNAPVGTQTERKNQVWNAGNAKIPTVNVPPIPRQSEAREVVEI